MNRLRPLLDRPANTLRSLIPSEATTPTGIHDLLFDQQMV